METINTLMPSREFGKTLKDASDADYRRFRDNYDNLLGMSLELWQIIPCSESGEVLEEPKPFKYIGGLADNDYQFDHAKWVEQKNKCLFQGIEVDVNDGDRNDGRVFIAFYKDDGLIFCGYFINGKYDGKARIERLAKKDLTLTQTAKEMIYGK